MRQIRLAYFSLVFLFGIQASVSQQLEKLSASEIYHEIEKLNFLGTALYIAAHPDDENTRLISYLANEIGARTIYLSLTRGDGGQNLIGPEIRELLGVIRTEELLAARKIDKGEQRFTRANDFGFSKHPDETLKIWDKEKVLADVIWAVRSLKPDIIINRFNHDTATWGNTHGHHTSSALLSLKAFELANDPKAYPSQLSYVSTWQPRRLFFNTSWWFYGSQEAFEKADKSRMLKMDVGGYYPWEGLSNTEIAALSRSQHRSQGFGSSGTRGTQEEYLELLKGDMPSQSNLFQGIDTSWKRIKGGEQIEKLVATILNEYDFRDPSLSIPKLIEAYQLLNKLEDSYWKSLKTSDIVEIIAACAGLYLQATADEASKCPGESVKINLEATNRSNYPLALASVTIKQSNLLDEKRKLDPNKNENISLTYSIPSTTAYSSPYWLNKPGTVGMYEVYDPLLVGLPETPAPLQMEITIISNDVPLKFHRNVIYSFTDPAKGEIHEPFHVLPKASVAITDKVYLFPTADAQEVKVKVRAGTEGVKGRLKLNVPAGWKFSPSLQEVSIDKKGDERSFIFSLVPPAQAEEGSISAVLTIENQKYDQELISITYDHIPKQSVLLPAEAKAVRLNITVPEKNIGYIAGAGDEVPVSLRQLGFQVYEIPVETIEAGNLDRFDAIVMGIRAYNTIDALEYKQPYLLEYVKNGGTLVVQYNTGGRGAPDFLLAPYPLSISRDRVTEEDAKVSILVPEHPLMNYPNKISEADFEGWVQERGLYFPDKWADEFTPLLGMHDQGEEEKKGSLLVTSYGKGFYIYTGLSFFRELPEGVPGAYRLFVNMLSLKDAVIEQQKIKG